MDDDTFNIERQYEPAPGRWRAGDSMDGDNRKIRVHLWHDTCGRYFDPTTTGGTGTWERFTSPGTDSWLWPPP